MIRPDKINEDGLPVLSWKENEDGLPILKKKESGVGNVTGTLNGGGPKLKEDIWTKLNREAIRVPEKEKPEVEIDDSDPIGSFSKGILANTFQEGKVKGDIQGLKLLPANQILKEQGTDKKINPSLTAELIDRAKKEAFPTTNDAESWLNQEAERNNGYIAPSNTTANVAKEMIDDKKNVTDILINNNNDLEASAIQYYGKKNDLLGKKIRLMNGNVPEVLKGNLLAEFLELKPVKELASESPNRQANYNEQRDNIMINYPEVRKQMILQKIGQGREDFGYNNPLLNLVGKKSSDEIVNTLVATGQLSEADKEFYNEIIRPSIAIEGIPTPGLIESGLGSTAESIASVPKSVMDITGISSLTTEPADRVYDEIKKDYSSVNVNFKGTNKVSNAIGHLTGVIVPIGAGAKALQGLSIIKNANTANRVMMAATFYHGLYEENLKAMPNDEAGAHFAAVLQTLVYDRISKVLPSLAKNVTNEINPSVRSVMERLATNKITGSAAAEEITNTVLTKAKDAAVILGDAVVKNVKMATEMGLATVMNENIKDVFSGKHTSTLESGAATFETMLLGGGPLALIAARGKNRKVTAEEYDKIAENPEAAERHIQRLSELDAEFAKAAPEYLQNLKHLSNVHEALKEREDLTPEQKKKFQLLSVSQKLIENKIKKSPDKGLNTKDENDIAEIEIEKKIVLDSELSNTKIVQEFYDNELLGKGSMELLSVRDADGKPTNKFDPSKTGEYLKEVAQRTNNLDSDWKPNSVGNSSEAAKSSYPESIVEIANKRWAKEIEAATKKKGVSVIMPEENKSPDIVPLKQTAEPPVSSVEGGEVGNELMIKNEDGTTTALGGKGEIKYVDVGKDIRNNDEGVFKENGDAVTFYNGGGNLESGTGIYFTPNKELAKSFAEGSGALRESLHGKYDPSKKSTKLTEANLVTKNPKKILYEGNEITPKEIEQYKKDGYDSVISYANGEVREIVVFDKSQIVETEKQKLQKQLSKDVDAPLLATSLAGALKQTIKDAGSDLIKDLEKRRKNELEEEAQFMKGREKSQIENSKRIINEKYDKEIKIVNDNIDRLINSPSVAEQSLPKGEAAKQPATKKESDEKVSNPPKEKPADERKAFEVSEAAEKGAGGEKPPISEPPTGTRIHFERPATELSHRGLQDVANEFSLPDVQTRDRKSDVQLRQDATNTANEWAEKGVYGKNVEKLVEKAESGEILTDEQRVILEQHLANVSGELRSMDIKSPKYDAKLAEVSRLKDAGEKTRSEAGAALRIPTGGSREKDIVDFMVEEKDVSGVETLTDKQKETVQKEWNDINKAKEEFAEHMAEKEAEFAKKQAQGAFEKQRSSATKTKKTHADHVEYRKKVIEDIREKLRKARGDTSATIVPYAKELVAIAPDVAKLVKDLIDEGVTKLADVVKDIHGQLKDDIKGITEKDVNDLIAGVYNEKKKTRSELAAKAMDLKLEANLINKLESLESGVEPKSEKKKIERNRQITELKKKIQPYTDLQAQKTKMANEIQQIQQQLKSGDFSKEPPKPPMKLDEAGLQLRDQLIKLRQARELRLLLQQRQSEGSRERALRLTAEVANIPRTLMTIMDFSALLRQNLFFSVGHPIMTSKALPGMFKSFTSQKVYDAWFADYKESPRYEMKKESKLAIADTLSHDLSKREESFMSSIAEKIPLGIGQIVKGSERSYTMLLNKMRSDMFDFFAGSMESRGVTFQNSPKAYKAMAEYINNATGRSDFGETLNRVAPVLNSVFFSPRLIASRVNMLTYWAQPRFWKSVPKEVRVDYFRNWISLLAVGGTILGLAQLAGADVEDDPRSSDFGKIKSGNTRWDIWGGAQPYVRVLAQVVSGERKSTRSGKIYELSGDDIFGETRGGVVLDFFRNKLAPVPGAGVDILSGRTTIGDKIVYQWGGAGDKEISIDQYVKQRILPMTITGTEEAMKDSGVKALFTVGIPNIFGVGTQTYENKKTKDSSKKESGKKEGKKESGKKSGKND